MGYPHPSHARESAVLSKHFGEQDAHIPMGDIAKIKAAQPSVPVYTYASGHGFNCDERGSFDKASADLARERTLAFFGQHVG